MLTRNRYDALHLNGVYTGLCLGPQGQLYRPCLPIIGQAYKRVIIGGREYYNRNDWVQLTNDVKAYLKGLS